MSIDPRASVLKKINNIREAAGFPALAALPLGVMCDPEECPVQMALRDLDPSLSVGRHHITMCRRSAGLVASHLGHGRFARVVLPKSAGRVSIALNKKTRAFIARFDDGEYPELDVHKVGEDCNQLGGESGGGGGGLGGAEGKAEELLTVPAEWSEELQPA